MKRREWYFAQRTLRMRTFEGRGGVNQYFTITVCLIKPQPMQLGEKRVYLLYASTSSSEEVRTGNIAGQ